MRCVVWVAMLAAACASTPARLADVHPEPPGANCEHGGVAIATGDDANGNGRLDADEIESAEYVCHGDDGDDGGDGTDGTRVVVDTEVEPPGANCEHGGTRIRTGVDEDDDGVRDTRASPARIGG
jgi:hypothetical protein